ncbi:MAG: 4-alpha-glucanotransferase [Methylococcales bacterium]|nr:4-alpha-glucanotransferase [Methylococcales bacterium]
MKAPLSQRRAGVLLHITSLPSRDLGQDAYYFVDFLKSIGASVWQVLPLGITHEDSSPYQSLSAHAGNPHLISLQWLVTKGWLTEEEVCESCESIVFECDCLLNKAFVGFNAKASHAEQKEFAEFCTVHDHWLDDFAVFMVLRQKFGQTSWNTWADEYKNRHTETINDVRFVHKDEIHSVKFSQYLFFKQWTELKTYANEKGVLLFGDIPIFVSYDSADVWANRDVFKLNDSGEMSVVAGVPPDYFSETGQRWGNPHYDWKYLHADEFKWWLERMETQGTLFDIVRIDHFRGLESAWEIPATEPTAIKGEWVLAAGEELLSAITAKFPDVSLVAEDLGIITPEVDALRKHFNLPGMKIMQFAFSGEADNPYLPENHETNSVVYTGTHDNDTTIGWEQGLSPEQRTLVRTTLSIDEDANITQAMMRCTLNSIANLAILPMQDILQLDAASRMNTPGTTVGNWQWCFSWEQVTSEKSEQVTRWIRDANRVV